MSRSRLYPTPAQRVALLEQCRHARYLWNLAIEQWSMWTRVYAGTHRRPTRRKAGLHEGFRIVGSQASRIVRLNRKWARALVPKVGWVRFRLSRAIPDAKSYRITRDRTGRWHLAFAEIPPPIPAPGTGEVVGVDRGVAAAAALSTGELLSCPGLSEAEQVRLKHLQRRLVRCRRGSNRRRRAKAAIARLQARAGDRRKGWVEKTSTDLARRFDVIRVEDLRVAQMTRRPKQTCSVCGHCAPESRESQAVFRCVACGHRSHADVNAAMNIAAGRAVSARRETPPWVSPKREPQHATAA